VFLNADTQHVEQIISNNSARHVEQVTTNNSASASTSVMNVVIKDNANTNKSKVKQKKRKNIDQQDLRRQSNDDSNLAFWSPPASRLRSKKRPDHGNDVKIVSDKKKNSGGKRK
jgi:hypothetical protein